MSGDTVKQPPKYMKFILGGTSGMIASSIVQPLDLVKTRMQMSGEGGAVKAYNNTIHAIQSIAKSEGFFSLYAGLSAALLRQATYTTTRLGIYTSLFEHYSSSRGSLPPFSAKLGMGITAGIVGALVGTPTEVCLIRMTADGRLPLAERRNYSHVFNALFRIAKEEGILALWTGAIPTMGRAAVVNGAQLVSYSQFKQILLANSIMPDGIGIHLVASVGSALITTTTSLPVDIAKTRIQNMRTIDGKSEYSGVFGVFSRIIRQEGVLALWKGFTPYLLRIGPHTILTFIILEQLNQAYSFYILGNKNKSIKSGL